LDIFPAVITLNYLKYVYITAGNISNMLQNGFGPTFFAHDVAKAGGKGHGFGPAFLHTMMLLRLVVKAMVLAQHFCTR